MMDRWIETLARSHARATAALFALCLVFFLPGLFAVQPMDRDEPRFAQASKQMLETGDFVDIRFQDEARHKKPVGIYWLQSASVKVAEAAGFTEARGTIGFYRIPSLLGAIATVLLTYWTALAFLSRPAAFLAAAVMAGAVLLGVEARLAKTDAVLTATVIGAMGALARVYLAAVLPVGRYQPGLGNALVFWLAIGIGVLIKGPITPLIPLIVAVILSIRERSVAWLKPLRPWLGLLIVSGIALPWLVAIALKSGGAFFTESVGKDMLGKVGGIAEKHWGPPGAYFLVYWATFWPAAPIAALGALFAWRERRDDSVVFLIAWLVPMWLILEALPTKLPHYVLPLYPALAILLLMAIERRALPNERWRLILSAALIILIPALALVGAPLAFWRLDGSVPFMLLPFLLAAMAMAVLSARALLNEKPVAALVAGLIAAVPFVMGAYIFGLPRLEALNISPRLAALAKSAGCASPAMATAGYREPSLVFLTNTSLRMVMGQEVAGFLKAPGTGCRIAFVESREEPAFKSTLTAPTSTPVLPEPVLLGRVEGFNINGGRKLDIGVWVRR